MYLRKILMTKGVLFQLQVIKVRNSIDGKIFKDLQQIASEHATNKNFEEGTENDKPVNFITVKEEALVGKKLVFKAAFKEECDAPEQRYYGGMEVILSTKGELGVPTEEPARLGIYDCTHGSQEGDLKMEKESMRKKKREEKKFIMRGIIAAILIMESHHVSAWQWGVLPGLIKTHIRPTVHLDVKTTCRPKKRIRRR